jgi:large conductance mechanosensitive channel
MADLRKHVQQQEVLVIAIGLVIGFALKDFVERFISAFVTPVLDKVMGGAGQLTAKVTEIGGVQFKPGVFIDATIRFFVISAVVFGLVRAFNTAVYQARKAEKSSKKK